MRPLLEAPTPCSSRRPALAETGITHARFRFDSAGGLGPGGIAPDGEVEDYSILMVAGCLDEVTRSNETISGPIIVEACSILTLDPNVVVEGAVTLRAGLVIVVGNGFETSAGADVIFEIDPLLLP